MDKQLRDKNAKLVGFIRSYEDRDEIRSVNGTLKGFYYYKLNYRVIVLTKYPEIFFNNSKIYLNLDSGKLSFLRKIIFKILFKIEGKNIIKNG